MASEKGSKNGKTRPPRVGSRAITHLVELARAELREQGLSEAEIDALLNRRTAPDEKR
jgi:hypothetical protein